jgi:hypothetical protein
VTSATLSLAFGLAIACLTGCRARSDTPPAPLPGLDAGAPRSCSLLPCNDGVSLEFAPHVRGPGVYQLNIVAERERLECAFELLGPEGGGLSLGNNSACRGFQLGGRDNVLEGVFLPKAPTELTLELVRWTPSRSKRRLIVTHLAPRYEIEEPNGAGCEPSCRVASATIRLTP